MIVIRINGRINILSNMIIVPFITLQFQKKTGLTIVTRTFDSHPLFKVLAQRLEHYSYTHVTTLANAP